MTRRLPRPHRSSLAVRGASGAELQSPSTATAAAAAADGVANDDDDNDNDCENIELELYISDSPSLCPVREMR